MMRSALAILLVACTLLAGCATVPTGDSPGSTSDGDRTATDAASSTTPTADPTATTSRSPTMAPTPVPDPTPAPEPTAPRRYWDGLPRIVVPLGGRLTMELTHSWLLDTDLGLTFQQGSPTEVPYLVPGEKLVLNDPAFENRVPVHDHVAAFANGTRYDVRLVSCRSETRSTDVREEWTVACTVEIERSAWPHAAPKAMSGTATVRLAGDVLEDNGLYGYRGTTVLARGGLVSADPLVYAWAGYNRPFDGERADANGVEFHVMTAGTGATVRMSGADLAAGKPIAIPAAHLDLVVTPSKEGPGGSLLDYAFRLEWAQTAPFPEEHVLDFSIDRPRT